jgi:predicted nucleic acid-binding protein
METFVVDAHSLIWFIAQSPKLSDRAAQILRKAEQGEVEVLVPTIVLAETLYVSEKKRVPTDIGVIVDKIYQGRGFAIIPFDFMVFEAMRELPAELEMHDRIIAATSQIYGARVITKDKELSKIIETEW